MIDLVRDLAQLVTGGACTVERLTARLGAAEPAPGPAVRIAPSDSRLRSARITKTPDGAPYTIALELARPLAVAELTAAFGAYAPLERSEPGAPWPLLFLDAVRGPGGRVALLVEVAAPLSELGRGESSKITLRIDPPAGP